VAHAVGIEPADPAQASSAAVGAAQRIDLPGRDGLGWPLSGPVKERARFGNIALATVVAQNSVMADAHQARGQQVQAEAADELSGWKAQLLERSALSVIAISEGDQPGGLIDGDDAPVAQGDAVGVVGQVTQHLLGPAQRTFGVERPALGIKQSEPLTLGRGGCGKPSGQTQLAGVQKPA